MKTHDVAYLIKHIDKSFQIIAKDSIEGEDDSRTISILSIHPSIERRQLIDLHQTLQITAAFEFYIRKYLPTNMIVEKDSHVQMIKYLEEIANKSKGKLKKLAKSLSELSDHVIMESSLEDKVVKVYNGYDCWKALDSCIAEEWYIKGEIRE